MKRLTLVVIALFACRGGTPESDAPQTTVVSQDADTTQLVMPDFPLPEPGRLVTHGNPDSNLTGSWNAWAGRCAQPPLVQLISQGEGFGAVVLIGLPDSLPPPQTYAIVSRSEGVPGMTARVAVQYYVSRDTWVFDGVAGDVILDSITVGMFGRFAATLRDQTRRDEVLITATFDGVPVRDVDEEWCEIAGGETDTIPSEPRP